MLSKVFGKLTPILGFKNVEVNNARSMGVSVAATVPIKELSAVRQPGEI